MCCCEYINLEENGRFMTAKLLQWKGFSRVADSRISPFALSVVLFVDSVLWLVSTVACYATSFSKDGWSGTPLIWMLAVMVTPSICFAFGVLLVDTRQQSRLSRFDWRALAAAFLPVTLGSFFAVLAVKVIFGASFREASVGLRAFGALAVVALVAISGAIIWQTARNYLSGKRADAGRVV